MKCLTRVVVGSLVGVAVLVGAASVASADSGDGSLSVGTGYAHEGVEDLIWAADHMGYESPADLQKTGVLVIRFILVALGGITEQECDLGFETAFNPYGPHRWVTEWAADDLEALEWVADHYCISPAQAQAFGGTLFAFFAGLDAAGNGTTAVRRDPPPDPSEQTIPGRPSGLVATASDGQVALSWTAPTSGATSYTVTYYDPALATVLPAAQVAFWKIPPGVVEPHIVGGGKVSNSDHPYQVALLTASDSSGFTAQFCSGTLVAPRWVVTAAHCVASKTAAGVEVGVGKDDLALIVASDRHVVSAINVHPSYDSATYANDIALLQLSAAVTSSTAKWIPWQADITEPAAGTTGTVSGWGTVTLDESIYRNELQGTVVKVLESPGDDLCGAWANYSATEKLCVGGERNVGACTGDSGGPLAINLGYTHLVGIASYGADDECADVTYPNVMTRVSNYDAWLQSYIGNPWVETTPTTTSATITGLANGTEYTFYVTAINADGNSSYAISATATPYTTPGTPTGLTATQGVAEVALSWTAPASNGGSALTDYTIEYSSDSGTTWTTFADGTSTTASTTVTGLSHSMTYTFRVSAVNAAGTGTASDTASVATATTAGAPTGLTATQGVAEVALAWTAPASDGGTLILDYTIEYSSDSGTTWTTFADGMSLALWETVTGLEVGTTYTFRISAVNAAGTGTASATDSMSVASAPGAPTGLSGTKGLAQISLAWTAPSSDGGSAVTDYTVEYSSNSGTTWSTFADGTSTATSTTVTDLSHSTTYTFRVSAVNVVATGSPSETANAATRGLTITELGSPYQQSTSVAVDAEGNSVVVATAIPQAIHVFTWQDSPGRKDVLQSADNVGFMASMIIGADHNPATNIGGPVVAYYDQTNLDLMVGACNNLMCNSTITTLDSTGDVGSYNSIVLGADGNPVIAYYDATNTALKVAACSNPTCTSATITTVNDPRPEGYTGMGQYNSIALGADNNPIISYYHDGAGGLEVAACSNPTCTSATLSMVMTGSMTGLNTSIAIGADDNPIISFTRTGHDLFVAACGDTTCTSGTSTTLIDSSLGGSNLPDQARGTQIAVGTNGLPVILKHDAASPFAVSVIECGNAQCSSGNTRVTIDDGVGSDDPGLSLAIRDSDNARIITYRDDTTLKIAVLEAP